MNPSGAEQSTPTTGASTAGASTTGASTKTSPSPTSTRISSPARKRGFSTHRDHPPDLGGSEEPSPKRPRFIHESASPSWSTVDETWVRPATTSSPRLLPRHRSNSPTPASLLEATSNMLNRAEETGGNRTVKLSRGTPGSPAPTRSTPQPSHRTSDYFNGTAARPDQDSPDQASRLLRSVGLVEFLQQDDRPIFVVDIEDIPNNDEKGLPLLFSNDALKTQSKLLLQICGRDPQDGRFEHAGAPLSDFKAWVLSNLSSAETISKFPFAGVLWKSSIVRQRFKVITGQSISTPLPLHEPRPVPDLQFNGSDTLELEPSDPATAQQPGYFDAKPVLPHTRSSTSEAHSSVRSPLNSTPASRGDIAYSTLLAGHLSPAPETTILPAAVKSHETSEEISPDLSDRGFYDWTRLPMTAGLDDHIQFARSIDWASTDLGPIESWQSDLRAMCNLIMASPHPAAMYWGPEHTAIYNEPYILLAGQKHPSLMGARYGDAWVEIWDALKETFDNAYNHAQSTMKDDDCLFIVRNGFLEETYFSWSIIPLISSDGSVAGLYNPCFEKTRRKVAERRMLTLREVGEKTSMAREVSQFWNLLLEGLSLNEYDAPLVMIYSLDNEFMDHPDASASGSSSGAASKIAHLEGTLGVPHGHQAAPQIIDLKTSTAGFASTFRQAITQDGPVVLRADDESLNMAMFEGIQWRGFGDPSKVVVVSPIHPTSGESTLGFVVIGTNPRRPYDEDYDLFVQLLARQLATSIASVVLFEDEIRKGERQAKLAAQDRIELNNQLIARTQEAVEAENKFTRMAELAPVGMYIADSKGLITFVNDAWYDITSFPRDQFVGDDWINAVLDEDKAKAWGYWQAMLRTRSAVSEEFRFKTPWRDRLGETGPTWVLASMSPEKDEDGKIARVFGSITDISGQKFAENLQKKRMEEAVELKKQLERYVDTTSHEMRNPLSAILQSADSITGSLHELQTVGDLTKIQRELVDISIDSAQTITLCSQHQKRIVDDVLTLSKLDSAMMSVTPIDVQPLDVVQRVMKMFENELQNADISFDIEVSQEYSALDVNWVKLDSHRLTQVLINLMTNAIKFTTMEEKRTVTLFVTATLDKPSQNDHMELTFVPTRQSKDVDVTASPEWGLGEAIYLKFAIQDSGPGLTATEKAQLFQRFSQANPKTHVVYGGSGLGLFISRELVELQGGEIGVKSEAGWGSTFAFYVKARRTEAPKSSDDPLFGSRRGRKGSKNPKLTKLKANSLQVSSPAVPFPPPPVPGELSKSMSAPSTVPTIHDSLHVLLVEDNLINQKVLAMQLRKVGCIVYVANHGVEAIDQISRSQFFHIHNPHDSDSIKIDIVLLDLEMPVMDGQTCARKLRSMQMNGKLTSHIPLIAVTANAREEQIRMAKESGIDDVVSKPFRLVELLPKMKEVIARFERMRGAKLEDVSDQ